MVLRSYQKEAVNKISKFFYSNKDKGKIYLSSGLDRTDIIIAVIREIFKKSVKPIVIFSSRRIVCERIKEVILESDFESRVVSSIRNFNNHDILVTTYQDFNRNWLDIDLNIFSMVICDEAHFLKEEQCDLVFNNVYSKVLGILPCPEIEEGWFKDADCLFSYTSYDLIRDGLFIQFNEQIFVERFFINLLKSQNFENIEQNNKVDADFRADIVANRDGKNFVFEVKVYRNLYNSKIIIDNALNFFIYYKKILIGNNKFKNFEFIVVMACDVDIELKKEMYEKHNIIVWDIHNLIYLCKKDKKLSEMLVSCMSYPILGLELHKPFNFFDKCVNNIEKVKNNSLTSFYQRRLLQCKPGKIDKADKEYEKICTDIIIYLFGSEFLRYSEQHRTGDDLFRMDLLCSLKGTTEFWKFLIQFYSTKFVVFEYKNCSDFISQNLIYITEKYLFPVALRNVAFIISRNGFDLGAEMAALGCLRESGKLIVSLNDEDLIKMVSIKENGEEPSDYLLDKVEQLLMSVSK